MKHFKNLSIKKKLSYFLFATTVLAASVFGVVNFKADDDSSPSHAKQLSDNGDGTYQIALDVTGDSIPKVETTADVNVVLVYDVSQSMTNRISGNTGPRRADAAENVVHDFLVTLAGYQNENKSNIQVSLVRFSVNGSQLSGWTNNINTNNNSLANMFGDGGQYGDAKLSYSNMGSQNMGTNWEHPLRLAQNLIDNKPLDGPTFVIMITDGAPTKSGTSTGMGDSPTSPWYDLRTHYNAATDEARAIENIGASTETESDDATLYGIYAAFGGTEADLLDDLLYYANTGNHRSVGNSNIMSNPRPNHDYGETESAPNYYNANQTSELEGAIAEILSKVINAMGVTEVNISDGTTTSVKASSGTVHLLNVDQTSYKYLLSMDVTQTSDSTYINNTTGNTITFVGDENSATGTWTDKDGDHQIEGNILTIHDPAYPDDETKTKTIFRMEWTEDGNALHPEAPTPAELVTDENGNDSVDWDLSSHGVLLNGVTYTVTFDVWPTQYTYDLIADLENGTVDYADLHEGADSEYAGLDRYISKTLTGKYYLETNTTATLSYKDTRLENPTTEYATYENPPAQELKADKIDVVKKWENKYDSATGNAIQIIINRATDEEKDEFYRANLDFNNDYTVNDISIATGLMRLDRSTGKVQVLESGHDYSFEEINGQHYRWEFVAQTVHPMLINGELHELILLDEAATQIYTVDDTLKTYTIPEDMGEDDDYFDDGEYEYVRIDGNIYVITGATPTIKAFNYRRSNLNLNKVVDGKAADPNALYEFTIDIEDEGLEDDEKLWFSIYDENNEVIIDENLPVSEGWTPEVRDGAKTGFYSAPQGTTLVVSLKVGQNLRFTNLTTKAEYTIVESDKENFVFTGAEGSADYGSNHQPFDYDDYEVDTDNKTITGNITMTNSTFNITANNKYELASIEITKKWDDNDNQDGKRTDEIEVQIYRQIGANGTPSAYGEPVTIEGDVDEDTWTYTIESTEELKLPRYDSNGNEYLYTVKETAIDGYDTEYDPEGVNQTNGKASYTITNKHVPELYNKNGKLKITKHWDDADNQDGLRTNVEIELIINGEPSGKTITLNTTQDNSAEFTDLPMYEDGVAIEYTIRENTDLTGYEDPDYDMDTPGDFTVTNKHVPELYNKNGKLKVTKHWDDNDNYDGLREDVEIELIINGEPSGKTITLDTTQDNSDEFTDLPMYEDGVAIEYTISENTDLTGYEDPDYDMDTPGDFTVTNVHGVVPVSIDVTKKWVDNDNQDGKRQDEITVKIFANDKFLKNETIKGDKTKDTWTYTIRGLDKYENGQEIEYTLEEVQVEDYEEPVVTGDAENGFTIINTHNPSKISKTVKKTWDHTGNKFDYPNSITVILHAKVGDEELDTVSHEITASDNWEYTFADLDEYKDGNIITYWIDEAQVTDYTTNIEVAGDVTNIKNTYSPATFNINGTKTWDDENDQDGKRPDHITVTLHGKVNGEELKDLEKTQDVYEKNGKWEYTFENVLKYAGGVEIEYSIEESPVDEYDEPIIHGTADEGFSITNHHTPETISYTVTKNWEDYNNADQIRPDSITVTLYKIVNGVRSFVETFEISEQNDWTYTFGSLPRYEGGKEITYDIVEDAVAGYTPTYNTESSTGEDGRQNYNATITNNQTIDIEIQKLWDDDNDYDRIRPQYITVKLYANGVCINTFQITKADNWRYIVEGLFKYENGVEIKYTIEEETVKGYITSIDGFNIINTHKPDYYVEEMPPKTGGEQSTNHGLILILTIAGACAALRNRIKRLS